MRTPFIIAEFASSHDGDLDQMLRGVQIAKDADADAFKTAWCSRAERVVERMHCPENLEMVRQYVQWPREWLPAIRSRCLALGLETLVTVDCPEDIEVVAPYVDRFKVASWGALDFAFMSKLRRYDKPVLISLGTLDDAEMARLDAWIWLPIDDAPRLDAEYLHCVSGYPTPLAEANLKMLHPAESGVTVDGFSDHTRNVLTGSWAVCAGARVLEVHFRAFGTQRNNPDFAVSLDPSELREYIRLARLAALAMGDGVKRCMPSEEKNRRFRYV